MFDFKWWLRLNTLFMQGFDNNFKKNKIYYYTIYKQATIQN